MTTTTSYKSRFTACNAGNDEFRYAEQVQGDVHPPEVFWHPPRKIQKWSAHCK